MNIETAFIGFAKLSIALAGFTKIATVVAKVSYNTFRQPF